jgi:hypothetical protein
MEFSDFGFGWIGSRLAEKRKAETLKSEKRKRVCVGFGEAELRVIGDWLIG